MRTRVLRLLIMHVSTRCDQTCAHCSIWKGSGRPASELGVGERLAIIREARSLGARAILFTGGEPLLCDHIEILVRESKNLGLSVQIATNGLGLSRSASWLASSVDEVYVSLDGPEEIHDAVRGGRMFARLKAAIDGLLALSPRPRLIGRSVVSGRNAAVLEETVRAAKSLGLDAVSFLPIDVTSEAFGGDWNGRVPLRVVSSDVAALRKSVGALEAANQLGTFVLEDAAKLTALAESLMKDPSSGKAPRCNAPEWSSVVEADGAIRPCFFQPRVALDPRASLSARRRSAEYAKALRVLGHGNAVCASCVCPKYAATGAAAFRDRLRAGFHRVAPRSSGRSESAA